MFGRKVVLFGTIIILILILTAIFAPIISPYAPNEINIGARLAQPSEAHLLGTDELGRDLISRIIYGSQISIIVGVVAVLIAGILGMGLGLIAGYFGGWLQTIIMRFIDALMAIPGLILMLAIAAVLGGGLKNVLISLGIAMMPGYCRLMCGQILALKERDFVMAADIIGASNIRIMLRHLLPNSFPPLIIMLTLSLGSSILAEASLSFLGIGIAPPTATWGTIVSVGYMYLLTNPLLSIAPGVAIFLVVLAFNLVGDGLRDALDPRLRGRI
jgi:peptide/nickel transport system permease protein/oligopeptide transport system permease protein